ncbi:2-amino-4-hydroxy-6-hydroxymethyldihydropteridine diphosphokinase [Neolewinella antarctica]|uniref:2-amino-4-hydroxy-6-hydroxymethyldihydropteridine pyrophosphokinase n=1 Tax=Neolewinella antarctica TaxID=442734 RepID=A0ABX0X6E7_9BACT|nr:2-amino-4-hydroxy-6-hydroxymethyldihydropteridine diphosphokinase [Neolewinella antarctica]NJC24712.1 2-amino-4-hydroxy-6-hydroxymethyldihydropteridine diphosphokinase [Neolewinella antarctica]
MKIRQITFALGGNVGDVAAMLAAARQHIELEIGPIVARSRELRTAAWGVEQQPDFLNQVIVVDPTVFTEREWSTSPTETLHHLLDTTQAIERGLGRERKLHWGPRTCDIDIIFVDRIRLETERLSLPHPWWRERDFVGGLLAADLPGFMPFGAR